MPVEELRVPLPDRDVVEYVVDAVHTVVVGRLRELISFDSDEIEAVQTRLKHMQSIEALTLHNNVTDRQVVKQAGLDNILKSTIAAIRAFLSDNGLSENVVVELESLLKIDFKKAQSKVQQVKVLIVTNTVCVLLLIRIEIISKGVGALGLGAESYDCRRMYTTIKMHPLLLDDGDYFDTLNDYLRTRPWQDNTQRGTQLQHHARTTTRARLTLLRGPAPIPVRAPIRAN